MKVKITMCITGLLLMLTISCTSDYLDIKRDKSEAIPTSLEDFHALLDNFTQLNFSSPHALGMTGSDDYYLTDDAWSLLPEDQEKNSYIWAKDIFGQEDNRDWNAGYRSVLYANIILEGLAKLEPDAHQMELYNTVKGGALFVRGMAFYFLSQQFCPPLEDESLDRYGLPLRVESDPTVVSRRSTVKETYRQIFSDLEQALELLPETSAVISRPSKLACYGLLSQIYLQLKDYEKSLAFADQALLGNDQLLDYNAVDASRAYPFALYGRDNPEIIYMRATTFASNFSPSILRIDTTLYELFSETDKRRELFFMRNADGSHTFRGSYYGNTPLFSGISTDELYLNRAECLARLGRTDESLIVLERLLQSRYVPGEIPNYRGLPAQEFLKAVLSERRKQLLFRGRRWSDLRRLNTEQSTAVTLVRVLNRQRFMLPPNDPRYTFPVPNSVIINSEVEQYPR